MAPTTTVLLLTMSENGQSNTILAIASELVSREHISVHVSSFPLVEPRVDDIRTRMRPGATSTIDFHPLPGVPLKEKMFQLGVTLEMTRQIPLRKSLKGFGLFDSAMAPWTGPEYMEIVDALKKIILEVDADMIVVDAFFAAAADACRSLQRRYIINNPTLTLELVRMVQPKMRGLWSYPSLGSGIPYPVPWSQLFNNIWIVINMIITFIRAPLLAENQKYRHAHGLKGPLPGADLLRKELNYITPSIREVDYPFSYLPENVEMCGPIVLDSPPVEESDPELAKWLETPGTRTVMISLGSNVLWDEKLVRETLRGLVGSLPQDVQVIWKLHKDPSIVQLARKLVEEQDTSARGMKRWRIEGWLEADPIAILQHKNVVCSVHHGGANSYLECCLTGTPQIILPQWFDLYDNADKAEYNGFGIYGSKTSAPDIDAVEFGAALHRVLGDHDEARRLREKAREVAELCRATGGRKTAVDYILTVVKRGKTMEALC